MTYKLLTTGFGDLFAAVESCEGFKTPLATSKALMRAAASVAASRLLRDVSPDSVLISEVSHRSHMAYYMYLVSATK